MSTIRRSIKHVIRMGNYESLTLEAEYTAEIPDGANKLLVSALLDDVDETLNSALEEDLKEASRLSDDFSYVRDWRK